MFTASYMSIYLNRSFTGQLVELYAENVGEEDDGIMVYIYMMR